MTQSLASLKAGQRARINGFVQEDAFSQRLMQLGILAGETVEVLRRAPAGDPMEIKILGYSLSLRKAEADLVLIDPVIQE